MDKEKEIEELKLIIAENMAIYSKAKMPYEEALRMCALGILASGYRNVKQIVEYIAPQPQAEATVQRNKRDDYDDEINF